jgi:outer membrane immunogenic protein
VSTDEWNGFGTLQGGYDVRLGNVIVGGLADFDFYPDKPGASSAQSLNGTFTVDVNTVPIGAPVPLPNFASVTSNIALDNVWSVGGRLGYRVTPETLIYGLGGYTQASIDGSVQLAYTSTLFGPQRLSLPTSDELHGYFVGGGGEVKIAQNLALRLEYRYANYRGETSSAAIG